MAFGPKPPESAVLLPINDFLKLVPVSRSGLYGMIRRNELRTVLVAGRRLVPRSEADRLATGENTITDETTSQAA